MFTFRAPSEYLNSGFSDTGHTEENCDTEHYLYFFNTYTFLLPDFKTVFGIVSTYVYLLTYLIT